MAMLNNQMVDAIRLGEIELAMNLPPILPDLGGKNTFKLVGPVWLTTVVLYPAISHYYI